MIGKNFRYENKTLKKEKKLGEFFRRQESMTTRLDTRPPVADGWAGAEMRISSLFDSCPRTNQPTDQQTDGQSLL